MLEHQISIFLIHGGELYIYTPLDNGVTFNVASDEYIYYSVYTIQYIYYSVLISIIHSQQHVYTQTMKLLSIRQ